MHRPIRAAVLLLVITAFCRSAHPSQEPGSHACAATADKEQRLACFDRAFPFAPAADATKAFGFSAGQLAEKQGEPSGPDRITAKVAGLTVSRRSGRGELLLDNGQKWDLEPGSALQRLGIGSTVTIRKAALGSFLLTGEDGIPIRAKRLD